MAQVQEHPKRPDGGRKYGAYQSVKCPRNTCEITQMVAKEGHLNSKFTTMAYLKTVFRL
jgi:hypothetical protein